MNHAGNPTVTGRNSAAARLALYALILLSGAAGLIYEVVWARQLTLFMGNTAVANAAVLSAFMLGLALGSLLLGRIADRTTHPLLLYAWLEIGIGIYGATTPWLFDLLQAGYAQVAGAVGVAGPYSHLPRFAIAVAAMLIPTFLMGGTLPLLVRHFTARLEEAQPVTSRIYGINTLGATSGAFAAGFLLLPAIGITQTLLFSALINLLVGVGVYGLLRGRSKAPAAGGPGATTLPTGTGEKELRKPWLLLPFGLCRPALPGGVDPCAHPGDRRKHLRLQHRAHGLPGRYRAG
jgi:spermidine synthase